MNYSTEKNNKVYIYGEIVSEAVFSHEVYGEGFYELQVKVMRLSGQADILPVTVSERIMTEDMHVGGFICALGQFRSYNKLEDGKSRLMLTVFIRELLDTQPGKTPIPSFFQGISASRPYTAPRRSTGKSPTFLIAVNRSYNKSDYIPAIAWGRNARFVRNLAVGDRVALSGRIQSREYQKKQPDESFVTMTAYEVSISKLAAFDDETDFDIDEEFDLYSTPHAYQNND